MGKCGSEKITYFGLCWAVSHLQKRSAPKRLIGLHEVTWLQYVFPDRIAISPTLAH